MFSRRLETYNGVYNKQPTTINGYDWWVARNDVGENDPYGTTVGTPTNQATTNATIYFSTSHNRWVIEAPDVYWEANITSHSMGQGTDDHLNDGNDRRRPHGIEAYFGQQDWFQFSLTAAGSKYVSLSITCSDTKQCFQTNLTG